MANNLFRYLGGAMCMWASGVVCTSAFLPTLFQALPGSLPAGFIRVLMQQVPIKHQVHRQLVDIADWLV